MNFSGSVMLSSIASWKENAINRCPTVPQYYISVEGWRHDNRIKTAVYSIEIGLKFDENVLVFTCERRYSDLRGLHKDLEKTNSNLPAFPPKKMFGKNDVDFVRSRHRQLHSYFERLPQDFRVEKNAYFIEFFGFNRIRERWSNCVQERLASTFQVGFIQIFLMSRDINPFILRVLILLLLVSLGNKIVCLYCLSIICFYRILSICQSLPYFLNFCIIFKKHQHSIFVKLTCLLFSQKCLFYNKVLIQVFFCYFLLDIFIEMKYLL